jgi:cytochrome c biogenesis protein CcmG/thiol:disulfide interchange protein DsbE
MILAIKCQNPDGAHRAERKGECQVMSRLTLPGAARWTVRLARRHRVISAVVVVFVALVIAVSVTTRPGSAASYKAAPAFTLAALGQPGRQVSLSQYAGQPVILNFWASWCTPCQQETPLLARWHVSHRNVILLGLDENDTVARALAFARAKGVSYPLAFDPDVSVASAYGVAALPQTFFINSRHQLVAHTAGAVTSAQLAAGLSLMTATTAG